MRCLWWLPADGERKRKPVVHQDPGIMWVPFPLPLSLSRSLHACCFDQQQAIAWLFGALTERTRVAEDAILESALFLASLDRK